MARVELENKLPDARPCLLWRWWRRWCWLLRAKVPSGRRRWAHLGFDRIMLLLLNCPRLLLLWERILLLGPLRLGRLLLGMVLEMLLRRHMMLLGLLLLLLLLMVVLRRLVMLMWQVLKVRLCLVRLLLAGASPDGKSGSISH